MVTATLFGPAGATYEVRSGRRYTADEQGFIAVDNLDDIADLKRSGCSDASVNWSRQIHEGLGGGGAFGRQTPPLHQVLFADQNVPLSADNLTILSRDASLYTTATIANATVGDVIGILFVVNGQSCPVTVLLPSGVTNATAALELANAINSNVVLTNALAAYSLPSATGTVGDGIGYRAYEASPLIQTSGASTAFDFPYGPNNSMTAINGVTTTVTLSGRANSYQELDGGPTLNLQRAVPGYTPVSGDICGQIIWQNNYGPGGNSVVESAAIVVFYDNPGFELCLNTLNDNAVPQQTLHLKDGVWVTGQGLADLGEHGVGSFSAPFLYANTTTFVAKAAPATPAAGTFVVYMDIADNRLKAIGPSGTITVLAQP